VQAIAYNPPLPPFGLLELQIHPLGTTARQAKQKMKKYGCPKTKMTSLKNKGRRCEDIERSG
jgi:hypothetical protein